MADREPRLLQGKIFAREKRVKEEVRREEKRREAEARQANTAPRGDLKTLLRLGLRFLAR